MKIIKARLKQEVTEEQFLKATFGRSDWELNAFKIDEMKATDLDGRIKGDYTCVSTLKYGDIVIEMGYEGCDMNIWDYKIINE